VIEYNYIYIYIYACAVLGVDSLLFKRKYIIQKFHLPKNVSQIIQVLNFARNCISQTNYEAPTQTQTQHVDTYNNF
jgi:hypothetical protein